MMAKIFKLIYIVALSIVVVTSCTTIEKTSTPEKSIVAKESELFSKIVEQQPQFSTLTTRCSIVIDKLSSKAQIKMINGEYIQISVQPLLGIEMFRIIMTKDSLIVVDKINSVVARESISKISDKLPIGAGISELQKMILGIPFVVGEPLTIEKINNFKWSSTSDGTIMKNDIAENVSISFVYDNTPLLKSTTMEYNGTAVARCEYSQYKADASGKLRPSTVVVQPLDKKIGIPFSVSIKNLSPEWNKTVVAETSVSSRYKEVSLESLIEKYIK